MRVAASAFIVPASNPTSIESLPPDVVIETVVPNANQLVAMAFTPDGRLLYTERTGNVMLVANGQSPVIAYTFTPDILDTQGERGLLGITVDPDFVHNHFVWVYYTRKSPTNFENRIARLILDDANQVIDSKRAYGFPVDTYIPIHNGGNLHFGPDGKLYVSVGNNNETNDASDPAQDLGSPLGKIHRFNPGVPLTIPSDNPFGYSSIYARGLRNSFDFDFDPIGGHIFATENGEACDDEINLILPGGNYGWRPFYPAPPCDDYDGADPAYNTIQPLAYWTSSIAPTGLAFYQGDLIPEWRGDAFMCNWKATTIGLQHVRLNAARSAIAALTVLSDTVNQQPVICRTDVVMGPEGALYYSDGGGWTNGSIKRLTRRTSFLDSRVDVLTPHAVAGGTIELQIVLQHRGTISNTFNVSVDPSGQADIIGAQTQRGTINFSTTALTWTGNVSGIETVTATYLLQVTASPTSTYWLSNWVYIAAPQSTAVTLNPQIVINGYAAYLPIARK